MRALALALLLAACGGAAVERPIMAPVDTPRPPRGTETSCVGIDWPPITLPTTAAEQAAGRQQDRALADAALEECDRRRSRAVRHIRRQGAAE
jgi:hypothetical protein